MFATPELSREGMARTRATNLTGKTLIKLDRMPHYVAALITSLPLLRPFPRRHTHIPCQSRDSPPHHSPPDDKPQLHPENLWLRLYALKMHSSSKYSKGVRRGGGYKGDKKSECWLRGKDESAGKRVETMRAEVRTCHLRLVGGRNDPNIGLVMLNKMHTIRTFCPRLSH